MKKALEKHDDNTPITEEQKNEVIDAARQLTSDY